MSDLLSVFDIPEDQASLVPNSITDSPMTGSQRKLIREAFALLGLTDAASQFSLVNSLLGLSIKSVADLSFQAANTLLPILASRVDSIGHPSTGNAWDDRTEDTWIDKL